MRIKIEICGNEGVSVEDVILTVDQDFKNDPTFPSSIKNLAKKALDYQSRWLIDGDDEATAFLMTSILDGNLNSGDRFQLENRIDTFIDEVMDRMENN